MTLPHRPSVRCARAASTLLALALAGPTLAQDELPADDEGWIEASPDAASDVDEEAAPAEEGELSPNDAPDAPPPPALAPPPQPPTSPAATGLPPIACPSVDLATPPVEEGGRPQERLLVLPLEDSAGRPEDTRILNDATVRELAAVFDVDYPPPGQVQRTEDGNLLEPPTPDPIPTERPRFQVVDGRCLEGAVSPEVLEAIATCERSACMPEIAEAVKADFIVYGQVATGQPPLLLYELKLYGRAVDRVVSRATAEGPNGRILAPAVPAVLAQLIPVPPPPPPLPPPPVEPTVLESPFFIGGAAVALIGAVATAASVAWLVDAELKLGTPEVHRDLKAAALTQWPYVAVIAAVSPAVIAAGLALMGVSPFLLLLGEEEEEAAPSEATDAPGGASR